MSERESGNLVVCCLPPRSSFALGHSRKQKRQNRAHNKEYKRLEYRPHSPPLVLILEGVFFSSTLSPSIPLFLLSPLFLCCSLFFVVLRCWPSMLFLLLRLLLPTPDYRSLRPFFFYFSLPYLFFFELLYCLLHVGSSSQQRQQQQQLTNSRLPTTSTEPQKTKNPPTLSPLPLLLYLSFFSGPIQFDRRNRCGLNTIHTRSIRKNFKQFPTNPFFAILSPPSLPPSLCPIVGPSLGRISTQ